MAQPDGTYMWLQSYIQHYTLQKWMKEAMRRGEQYLTYDQLMAKLDKYQELRAAAERNSSYASSFAISWS